MAISSNGVAGLKTGVCTSTTRPSGPYEGQMIYETDTDMVAIWNGTAWRYLAATTPTNGTVLQIVQASYSAVIVVNSTTTMADTNLTATITPKSSSSKILVVVHQTFSKSDGHINNAVTAQIVRNSTAVHTFAVATCYTGTLAAQIQTVSAMYLDSPATTSSTTYKTQFANFQANASVAANTNNTPATITLMEIAG